MTTFLALGPVQENYNMTLCLLFMMGVDLSLKSNEHDDYPPSFPDILL